MTPDVPKTFREALQGIQDREFLQTRRHRDQQWRAERKGADPEILLFERMLVRRMGKLGVPMFASEVMRSNGRQLLLHNQGVSKIAKDGPHVRGCAVDLVHGVMGWDMPKLAWSLIGHVGKEIIVQEGLNLRWGGDWKFYDPAHWERVDWEDHSAELPY